MTLLIQHGYDDRFILLTSDTMKRYQYIDEDTLKPTGEYGASIDDSKDKIVKLSDLVYVSVGGYEDIYTEYLYRLLEKVDPDDDLEDCKRHLEEVVKEVDIDRKDNYFLEYKTTMLYGVFLIGFYRNGETGLVVVESGQVKEQKSVNTEDRCLINLLAPTKEILSSVDDIFSYEHELEYVSTHFEAALTHFAKVQAMVSYTHPETVSSTLIFAGVLKTPDGKLSHLGGEMDLTPFIDILEKTET